jgi:serine/threonine protein kinase
MNHGKGVVRGHPIGIPLEFPIGLWRKAIPLLPRHIFKEGDKELKIYYHHSISIPPKLRAAFLIGEKLYEGTFGNLYDARRMGLLEGGEIGETQLLIKVPKLHQDTLLLEGIVQHYAHTIFVQNNLGAHIPRVFDIFNTQTKQICIAMENKATANSKGKTVVDWFVHTPHVETLFPYFLAQLALLMEVLHVCAGMDHRDLKANNLIVQEKSCVLTFGQKAIEFPFTIVIIDFGFSCVKEIDVSNGTYPPFDPCPKEGRDIFHILFSLWSIPEIKEKLSPTWDDWMVARLKNDSTHLQQTLEKDSGLDWIYIMAGLEKFRAPSCTPQKILEDLFADEWL